MRSLFWRLLLAVCALVLTGCQDSPSLPQVPDGDARLNTVVAPEGAAQSPSCCDPVIVVVPGGEQCDRYLQLDFSCDDDGDPCMSSTGTGEADSQTISACNDGWGFKPGLPENGGGFPPQPGDGDGTCNPIRHSKCEIPLTLEDRSMIDNALQKMLRTSESFTDPEALQQCTALATAFRGALARGAVFRGAFDSNGMNDPDGAHYGFTNETSIHFDPGLLDAANAGHTWALRQIAVTALHEVGHLVGFDHGQPTWDSEGRDSYNEQPFSRMNPGENSCVPR
jgi:hypothetical protein